MKRTRTVLVLGMLVAMGAILAGCGGSGAEHSNNQKQVTTAAAVSGDENTVKVQGQTFSPGNVTTKAGQSVISDGTGASASQALCQGSNGTCQSTPNGPPSLSGSGLTLAPGQSLQVGFPYQGTFQVTSPGHPQMNLSITVKSTP